MIDITLRGLNAAQIATLAAFLVSNGYPTANADGDTRFAGQQALREMADSETVNTAARGIAQSLDVPAADYTASLAANVFGKGANTPIVYPDPVPNDQAVPYAPLGSGVTAAPLTSTQPAAHAVGGMQGGAGVELDADGYPWDGRIHPTSKAVLVKEKTWKLIRGIDKNLVAQVRAEWDAHKHYVHSGQPLAVDVVQTTPAFNPAATAPVTRFNDQPVTQQPAAAAPYTPPAPATYAPPPLDYQALSAKITGAIATQRIGAPVVAGLLNHNGIPDLPSLANFPNLWLHISGEIDRLTGGV